VARRLSCDFLPGEEDLSAFGSQEARADIDEGGFPGTVRANHRETLTLLEGEVDIVGHNHPAEPKR
jgi:hypothetical protein